MTKVELVDAIATEAGISKKDAAAALVGFTEVVTKELKKGEKVSLIGFGTFSTSKRAARKGRNPSTGKDINIAASTVAKFKVGAKLKAAVN
jgi:DNA-binding protein HU-beta